METLGDLVARERRSDRIALRADAADRELTYHDFCTTAWKAGNYLRYLGVGPDDRVAIADDALPEPVLAFLGVGLLGAVAEFGIDAYAGERDEHAGDTPRVVVAPVDRETAFDLPGGSRLLTYGGVPDQTRTAHWEGDVWSENPAFPPVDVDPGTTLLRGDAEYSHAAVLDAAEAVVTGYGLDENRTVAVRTSLRHPGAVAAGVVAPLLAGGTVVFPDSETTCDASVGDGPESTVIDPDAVF